MQRGNMNTTKIEWTDVTWNPVTGCLHGCQWCFARRLAETRLRGRCGYPSDEPFRPTFHENRLGEPLERKKPAKIFVSDMGDLMGRWVDKTWIQRVLDVVWLSPRHTFQFLTKNPSRYAEFEPYPSNAWLGTSIESQDKLGRLEIIKQVKATVRFVSIEPLLSDINVDFGGLQWIIVGGMTGPKAVKPKPVWVENILAQANGIPVFLKNNLSYPLRRQEFPTTEMAKKLSSGIQEYRFWLTQSRGHIAPVQN
jgi:protein gp37